MFLNHDEEFFYHANNTKLMLFMRINQGFAFKKKNKFSNFLLFELIMKHLLKNFFLFIR